MKGTNRAQSGTKMYSVGYKLVKAVKSRKRQNGCKPKSNTIYPRAATASEARDGHNIFNTFFCILLSQTIVYKINCKQKTGIVNAIKAGLFLNESGIFAGYNQYAVKSTLPSLPLTWRA